MDQNVDVFTIGHSAQSYDRFLHLLKAAEISAVADVRSSPFSRRFPHFNQQELRQALKADGIAYVFLGKELGGRPKESRFFCDGVADYEKMRTSDAFKAGIDRVLRGAEEHRLALMCSEHNPLDCHRCLLVGRELADRSVQVRHLLREGEIKTQQELEKELLYLNTKVNIFDYEGDDLAAAYRARSKKVAYTSSTIPRVAAE